MAEADRRKGLDDVDLGSELAPGKRRKLNLAGLGMPSGDDDRVVEEKAEQLGRAHGATRQIGPDTEAATGLVIHLDAAQVPATLPAAALPAPAPEHEPEAVPLVSVHVQMPEYLSDALAMAALKAKTSKQYIIMQGLRALGYEIQDAHMIGDKRRAKK